MTDGPDLNPSLAGCDNGENPTSRSPLSCAALKPPRKRSRLPKFARAFFLSAAMSLVLASPAAASTECVLGSRAAPAELIAACSGIIDKTANPASDRSAALVVRAEANARTLGGQPQALRDLDRAIALDGRNAKAWRLRGDLDRALADYDQAIKLKPDDAQAWSDRGVAYYLGGDNEKAIRNFDEALRLDPNRPRTYTNRGAAWKKLGQHDKSVVDNTEAIRLDRKQPEYYDNRGLAYAAMGEYDKAIADSSPRATPAAAVPTMI